VFNFVNMAIATFSKKFNDLVSWSHIVPVRLLGA
jgi:hypothetical protein